MEAQGCQRCELAESRGHVVFGEGRADANVFFIGEAPGRLEDEQGLPFVGRSGVLLRSLLADAGVAEEEVFITSVIKCRPPDNRDPKRDEISACSGWLEAQVQLIAPLLICTLGNFALRLVRGDRAGISSVHGVPEEREVFGHAALVLPLFHPAAALRSTQTRSLLRDDIAQIPALLREAERQRSASPSA
ncbi:unannotated protein [freshwater metagenome]|uniref:Type-4 uracil-DNA glycosylase n=1 Tax=freshwater metagenome TaxID=449393 RepID=A0A6J7CQZ7_9ZZZZ